RTRLRIAALAAGLVALLALVALAARAGRGVPGGGSVGGPSPSFYDFAFTIVLIVGALISVAVLVSTLRFHSWKPRELGLWQIVRSILPILLLPLLLWLFRHIHLGHVLHAVRAQQGGQQGTRAH